MFGAAAGAADLADFSATPTLSPQSGCIFSKLQVADRSEAIVRARRAGLGADG
ncbi:MAG TPA: hypothetical protein VHO27_14345 [Angustibacter sp.]|nr:hypothetical protein [Angustibacter sp.]